MLVPPPRRSPPTRTHPGAAAFTLIELAVVLAIVAVLVVMAGASLARQRPRASLIAAASELQSLVHSARQTALAAHASVAVLVYPAFVTGSGATAAAGRIIVYQDACADFFTGGASCGVAYATYNPAVLAAGSNATTSSSVVTTMDLPRGVVVGPATGMGATASLPAPLAGVPVNLSCSFCGSSGGAIQFDQRGKATFYSLSGGTVTGPLAVTSGASLSLGFDPGISPDLTGARTLVILAASGAVETLATR